MDNTTCDIDSQGSDDPRFIIAASSAPDPFPVIIPRIRRVYPVVIGIRIDWDNVHMSGKHQRFDILGSFPFIYQGIGIHFGEVEVRMTTRKELSSAPRVEHA